MTNGRDHDAETSERSFALRDTLLLAGGILAGLLLAECLARVAIDVLHRPPIVVRNAHAGWAARPDLHDVLVSESGGRFRMSTDHAGRRIVYPPGTSIADETPATVLVGDSFVFGLSVPDSDTFPWQLARALPARRFENLGVPGWGTDQELVNLEDFFASAPRSRVSDVVVVVFENDFHDVQRSFDPYLGRRKPVFHVSGGRIDRGNFHLSMLDRLMDYSRLAWLVRSKLASRTPAPRIESDSGIPVVEACLREIRRISEAQGAHVHVIAYHAAGRALTVSPADWHDFLTESGAVDVTDSILARPSPNLLAFDGVHWGREGNRRVAVVIATMLGRP